MSKRAPVQVSARPTHQRTDKWRQRWWRYHWHREEQRLA